MLFHDYKQINSLFACFFRALMDKLHSVLLFFAAAYQLLHEVLVLRGSFCMTAVLYYSYNKVLFHKVRVYQNFGFLFFHDSTEILYVCVWVIFYSSISCCQCRYVILTLFLEPVAVVSLKEGLCPAVNVFRLK